MKKMHWPARVLAGVGLAALACLSGCQTWVAGMTLPSGHYLDRHPPQYFAPSPPFPLPRELASQERAAAEALAGNGGPAQPLPQPVPPLGGPGDVVPLPPPP